MRIWGQLSSDRPLRDPGYSSFPRGDEQVERSPLLLTDSRFLWKGDRREGEHPGGWPGVGVHPECTCPEAPLWLSQVL